MPPGITDKDYVIAQYDGAIAYMDACIQRLLHQLESLGILDDTIVVINSDHGETLYDHECWFDHHGLYDVTLKVPLIIRYPKKLPAGLYPVGNIDALLLRVWPGLRDGRPPVQNGFYKIQYPAQPQQR